ncbi:hypothetical protein JZ751_011741, partial [Albula glossodonta]
MAILTAFHPCPVTWDQESYKSRALLLWQREKEGGRKGRRERKSALCTLPETGQRGDFKLGHEDGRSRRNDRAGCCQ